MLKLITTIRNYELKMMEEEGIKKINWYAVYPVLFCYP
jgi:hypothetical protein